MKKVNCLAFKLESEVEKKIQSFQIELSKIYPLNGILSRPLHITIGYFHEGKLSNHFWTSFIEDYKLIPDLKKLSFDKIAVLSNQALVLIPDNNSFTILQSTIEDIFSSKQAQLFNRNKYPHITLWRKIDPSFNLDILMDFETFHVQIDQLEILRKW